MSGVEWCSQRVSSRGLNEGRPNRRLEEGRQRERCGGGCVVCVRACAWVCGWGGVGIGGKF